MILNNRFEEPYNNFPNDGPIPLLSKPVVKSKLSKKFWLYSQYLESQNLLYSADEFSSSDNLNNLNDNEENINNINYMNNNERNINNSKYKINYRRPKTSEIKIKNNNYNSKKKIKREDKKNQNYKKNIDEINELNNIIYDLQCELNYFNVKV